MINELRDIENRSLLAIQRAATAAELQDLKQNLLGKKGEISLLLRNLGQLDAQERPVVGKEANAVKASLQTAIDLRLRGFAEQQLDRQLAREQIDVTLPGLAPPAGTLHPITLVLRELREIFVSMGFDVARGPDVESDFNNFTALNIPENHPSRDLQDTFYLPGGLLLRTHTSPVQIRTMLSRKPPVAIIAPGAVYRCDADQTHSPMFHQVEGLYVDRNVSFAQLKGTLETFLRRFFGPETRMRFRPHYFPFTEPSAEVDIEWKTPEKTRWLEILGAGMVHPNVLRNVGYDPEQYNGFAFGVGIERLAMLKYGINDIRLFFENDLRFLRQF